MEYKEVSRVCEFCHKHGEGKKWYLKAENYSDDLLSDLERRKFIDDFFSLTLRTPGVVTRLENLPAVSGFFRRVLRPYRINRSKRLHHGQVLPIEDVERIFDLVSSVVRLPCICRHINLGTEQRYCYGISLAPKEGEMFQIIKEIDMDYLTGPDTSGLENLTKEEAMEELPAIRERRPMP